MRALGELRYLGCKVTNYSIDDDYYMMKYEHELHTSIRTKRNWMSIYNHMLVGTVKGIELLNNSYNPFDFSLKGLSNEVSADKNTYYEILGEIYEHYNVPGKKMNPWMRLFVTLIGTVVIVGGKNNAHKFIPGAASKVENDEELLEKLRAKAASGANSDITSLTGLTTALTVAQGGTGGASAASARSSLGLVIGTDVGGLGTAETWTASQRGTITTDNDGSFDQSVTNNFKCTPTGTFTLTFTNHTAGQSGYVLLVNTGGYAVSAAATTKVGSSLLSTISTAGTYLLSYLDDGTNAYVTASGALS